LILAVNGLGVGIGATIIGFADLVFMSSTARLKLPVHQSGRRPRSGIVLPAPAARRAPERGLDTDVVGVGRRGRGAPNGVAWKVCEPDTLLPEAHRHAEVLASRPISSLIAVKHTMVEPNRAEGSPPRPHASTPQSRCYSEELRTPSALAAFADRRD